MKIIETGVLACGVGGTARAVLSFPGVAVLSDGSLLATVRAGSAKDSSDETIELYRSIDGGRTWGEPQRPFLAQQVGGRSGSLKVCYLTELSPRLSPQSSAPPHLMAACMWVDRQSYPGQPLFNPDTEGCLPMAILLADSDDFGQSWSPWRVVPMPDDIGPPSLTSPILQLADGTLAMSIETNKTYHDKTKWYQRVLLFHSTDLGQSWGEPVIAAQDPTGRIFNWDQRAGVAPDGRLVTFLWTYDSKTHTYLNIHRRLSSDGGRTWSAAEDLGFTDQPAHPAILPDGRVVLAWVDRFRTHSIRARLAPGLEAGFEAESEVVIYTHSVDQPRTATGDVTGALLADMSLWSFGLPYAEVLPDGDVLVVYYAGSQSVMDIHWARLHLT